MSDLIIRQLPVGPLEANAYLIFRESREDCFVIDPGDDLEALRREIEHCDRGLTDILLTHGHFDHILSAAPLAKEYSARVHIHERDAQMLKNSGDSLYNPAWCRLPFVPCEADAVYPGDEEWTMEVCGVQLSGFRTPGHTKGSVCLLNEENSALFTGDTLFAFSYGRTDFPGGSDAEMAQSLDRLLGMERGLTVYSGHGEADTMDAIARRWRR